MTHWVEFPCQRIMPVCFFLLRLFLNITRPQIRKHLYIHTAPVRLAAGGGAESESGVVGVVSGYA